MAEKFVNFRTVCTKLGWKDEGTHNERLLRDLILTHSVASKMPEAEARAIQYFEDLKKNQKPVPPDFRWIAYSAGVKHGTPEDWNFAWKMYNSTQVASERVLWLKALASSNDPYILQQYLDSVFNRYAQCRHLRNFLSLKLT